MDCNGVPVPNVVPNGAKVETQGKCCQSKVKMSAFHRTCILLSYLFEIMKAGVRKPVHFWHDY
jgi:hypothetical protein